MRLSSSASEISDGLLECSTWTWVGAKRLVACKYSLAELLSPAKARSYKLSSSFWVRSGDCWSSDTRFSHSSLNAGFFFQRLRVVSSTPSWMAYFSCEDGTRFGGGTISQFKNFSCRGSKMLSMPLGEMFLTCIVLV